MFIVFEGSDGSGKSTLMKKTAFRLRRMDFINPVDVLETKEPGGTPGFKELRDIIFRDDLDDLTETFLFLADRAEHLKRYRDYILSDEKIVLSDRFFDSTLVYQSMLKDVMSLEKMYELNKFIAKDIMPDLSFYIVSKNSHSKVKNHLDETGKEAAEKYIELAKSELLDYKPFIIRTDKGNWEDCLEEIVKSISIEYQMKNKNFKKYNATEYDIRVV